MQPSTEKKLSQIKRTSKVLRAVCKGLLVLVAILFVASSISVLIGRSVVITAFDAQIPVELLTTGGRWVLVGLLALWIGVIAKGLYHLQRLFGSYALGEIFTTKAAVQIRQLGLTAILWAVVNTIQIIAFATVIHTNQSSPFQLRLDSAIAGAVIIVISWFMDAAAEMREENELTI